MKALKYEERLYKIFTNVNDWLKFAEAKNFGLLTLNAAIIFGFSQTDFIENSVLEKAGYFVFFPFTILSFLPCLISLFPIVSKIEKKTEDKKDNKIKRFINYLSSYIDKENSFENIHFYGYLKDIDEAEFENKLKAKTGFSEAFTVYETELSTQILYNSRITWLKYQFFKIGAFFFLTGVVLFTLSLPIFKFFS
ncbi:MAG: hypothetical protein IPG18_13485 [Saprospiraceae bacterium]|nr:hypothetical protein [Saprospiraceae bacterium]